MMKSKVIQNLASCFSRMPSIGSRTAERMALYVARASEKEMNGLVHALQQVREHMGHCKKCFHLAEGDYCSICGDGTRDQTQVCVVEQSADLVSLEKSGSFRGLYHVLLGTFSPLDGVGPSDIEIGSLMNRLKQKDSVITELVIATSPTANGEATALYLQKAAASLNREIAVTRIGFGVAMGSDLSCVDKFTLSKALQARTKMTV